MNACKLIIVLFFSITLLTTACANTADEDEDTGGGGGNVVLDFLLTINFAGNVDRTNYMYVVVFSDTTGITLPTGQQAQYLPLPGRDFNQNNPEVTNRDGQLSFYYDNFYDTFSDYVIVDTSGISLYKSATEFAPTQNRFTISNNPEISEQITSHNAYQIDTSFSGLGTFTIPDSNPKQLQISFQLQLLTLSNPTRLFYNILTFDKDINTQSGRLLDYIEQSPPSILMQENARQDNIADQIDLITVPPIPEGANILSWEVDIQ